MKYLTFSVVCLATGLYTKLAASTHIPFQYPEGSYDEVVSPEDIYDNAPQDVHFNDIRDEELENAMDILRRILILPWPNGGSPLLYVDNMIPEQENYVQDRTTNDMEKISPMPSKRMRYYRKYPWKRQNVKYDPDSRFICMPTKNEVHQLLVALHRSRYGNKNLSIDFCNRKRPAYSVFTNIHYLGK